MDLGAYAKIDDLSEIMKEIGFQVYKCECGYCLRRFYDSVQIYFCPNCGAKMEWK